jgi:APA family basic amino acid/polyamine antiporter
VTGPSHQAPALLRSVSRWEIVGLAVNDVVGSGVYLVLPVATARLLGPASVWAILGVGLAMFPVVLCFAEAGSRFDQPGGAYVYAKATLGEFAGFEIGWMTWVSRVSALSGLSIYLARALAFLGPKAQTGVGLWAAALLPLVALTAVNVVGVKAGARTAAALAVGKLVPLGIVILAGLPSVRLGPFFHAPVPSHGEVMQGTLLILFAYAGFENTAAPASEYKNPQRDIPFALVLHFAVVIALYAGAQLVAFSTVPDLLHSQTPLADAGNVLLGAPGELLLAAGAVVSVLGTNNNTVLTGARYVFALAEAGRLPAVLARVHPSFHTPAVALVTQTALAILLLFTGTAESLAELSALTRVASYVTTALAVLLLRRNPGAPAARFRTPGGPLIPLGALAVCAFFLASAEAKNWIATGIAVAVGAALYLLGGRRRDRPEPPPTAAAA